MKAQQKLKRVVALARDILKDAATGTLDGEAQAIYTATLDAYDRGRGRPAKFKTLVHKWRRAGVPLGGLAQLTLAGRLPGRPRKTTPQDFQWVVDVYGMGVGRCIEKGIRRPTQRDALREACRVLAQEAGTPRHRADKIARQLERRLAEARKALRNSAGN